VIAITKRIVQLLLFLVLFSSLLSFKNGKSYTNLEQTIRFSQAPTGEVKVVTTLSIIADWVAQIGEGNETIDPLFIPAAIVSGAEDPHTYSLTAGEIEMISNADLFIRFGLPGLEPWVDSVLGTFPSLNVLTLADESMMKIDPLTGTTNPHIWMDPNIARIFVQNISDEVMSLDLAHIPEYTSNRDAYFGKLDGLISTIENNFFSLTNGLKVAVHHPSFLYLFDLLGVDRVAVIEEHEGSEPSAQHIQEVIDTMNAEGVTTLVTQPQIEEDIIEQIARDTGAKLAKLTPLIGIEGAETYLKMIEYDVAALLNPEELQETGWIITAVAIGGSVLVSVIGIIVYFRYIRKLT
jgi:ABC-type Zn uptake system ZnuABC Zn-binding protein ZnuA